MAIKLVAIDIDGTLINDQRQITPQTVAAIKKSQRAGSKDRLMHWTSHDRRKGIP